MNDDRTLDRRSFLERASAAGLMGFAGFGDLGSRARRDGDEGRVDGDGANDAGGRESARQDRGIDYFQAVLPAGNILDADLVYRIVVIGGPIQPHERPPPLCFPEGEKQWRARDAVVVKPTTTTGLLGGGDGIGAINPTRAFLEYPVEPGTVYRISGGEYCDGYAQVTMHELPPRLSEYFSAENVERLDEILADAQNRTAENETAANATGENGIVENLMDEGGPVSDPAAENETATNETATNETVPDATDGSRNTED